MKCFTLNNVVLQKSEYKDNDEQQKNQGVMIRVQLLTTLQ